MSQNRTYKLSQETRKLAAARQRRWREKDPRPRVVDRWHHARSRGSDITLEEYAEHYERKAMGCPPSSWNAWALKVEQRERLNPQEQLRRRATRLQRPLSDDRGRRVWPSDWNVAMRFAWRYENDAAFRDKQVLRTKLRKYTTPSYAREHATQAGDRRKWTRAERQMG